jgi:hypothetical protein
LDDDDLDDAALDDEDLLDDVPCVDDDLDRVDPLLPLDDFKDDDDDEDDGDDGGDGGNELSDDPRCLESSSDPKVSPSPSEEGGGDASF